MNIIWTNNAKKDLRIIYNYYSYKASVNIANKIINSILELTQLLKNQNIGTIEPLLEHLNQEHRHLIKKNYKIIYLVRANKIYITHIFDTRQNPIRLSKNK